MKRRGIGLLLILCVLLSLLPVSVAATEAEESVFTFSDNADAHVFTKSGDTILIKSEEDWNALSEAVKQGKTCEGMTFLLTDDISVSRMIGEQTATTAGSRRRFAGTFDGGNHTLTVNYDATAAAGQFAFNQNYAAPFAYADNICVKNLKVAGTIRTNSKYAAGLVASLTHGGEIENVCVSVTINSLLNHGDGTHGGIVAINENGEAGKNDRSPLLTLTNCAFDGRMLGEGTYNCGGLVGYNKATVRLENCLFNPIELTFNDAGLSGGKSETLVRMENTNSKGNTVNGGNNRYTRKLGDVNEWAIRACDVILESDNGCTLTAKCEEGTFENRGVVAPGTILDVNAEAKEGYKLTVTPDQTYTVEDNMTITAKSKSVKHVFTVTLNHENGAEPTWSGVDALNEACYGEQITMTAGEPDEGYEFVGWYESGNKLLTEEETYKAYIYSNVTFEARYQQKAHKVVTFISNNIVEKTLDNVDSVSASDFPASGYTLKGYRFVRWNMTAEEVNEALASEALAQGGTVTVTAEFEPVSVSDSFIVIVYNGEQSDPTVKQLNASQWYKVSAAKVPGKTFAYWKCQQEGEYETRYYRESASFWITGTATITAVYAETPEEYVGTATLTSLSYDRATSKLKSVAFLTVPKGCTIRAAGLVAASNNEGTNYDPHDELTTENADYVKSDAKAVGVSGAWTYTWTKTKVNKANEVWYLRPYVIYVDAAGEEHAIYGDLRIVKIEISVEVE